MKTYILPVELRKRLKKPFGISILGKKKEVRDKFQQLLAKKKFKKIITVGDYCSLTLPSDIKIFDGKIKRKKINPQPKFGGGTLRCSNPRGTIQKGVWQIIKKAIKENKNVFVKGEEDLLAIPAVLLAGKNTTVVYGLPDKGICLIEISSKTKKIFKELLKKFIVLI
ncbi:GTP-dependent dephospho-CoA kinase family protein [Patescibacteria group bacterium]|nr:GTP-dependent dephospho-CoA kinase family protein [Patescibacteria group bacterium]MBU4480936.1 GTP-dependent dephospho-CoA kinase family protein [Patescibacteria group bacterium]